MRTSTFLSALALPVLALTTPAHPQRPSNHQSSISDWPHLSDLLDTIDESVLHGVLHQLSPKFQDGVFSKDRSALEHVHSESPAIATKLVHIAIKRQSNSTTTSSSSRHSTSTTATTASNQQSAISSALSSDITATTAPKATTIVVPPSAPADATAVATKDGGIVYSTIGGGLVTLTSSAVGVHFTPSTSTHLYYSTLPDGQVSTSTAVVVVNAPVTGSVETDAAGAAATTGSSPGLQDSADSLGISGVLVGFAALGAAILLI